MVGKTPRSEYTSGRNTEIRGIDAAGELGIEGEAGVAPLELREAFALLHGIGDGADLLEAASQFVDVVALAEFAIARLRALGVVEPLALALERGELGLQRPVHQGAAVVTLAAPLRPQFVTSKKMR